MNNRDLQDRKPTNNTTDGRNVSEKERIRGRMKMVIGQLEGILQELKEVAKELRDVSVVLDARPDLGWGQMTWNKALRVLLSNSCR